MKPDIKHHILYDPINVKCPEKANLQGQKVKDKWLPGIRGGKIVGLRDEKQISFCSDKMF